MCELATGAYARGQFDLTRRLSLKYVPLSLRIAEVRLGMARRMRERAADGKSCSEFIVRRCLDKPEPTPPEAASPAPVLRRVARLVLALEEVERRG